MAELDSTLSEPTFRAVRPEDLSEVAELLDAAFDGDWPGFPIRVTPQEHLEWKLDSPQVIPGGTTVLELGGRIVALDGSVGRDVWLSGQRHPGWVNVDSAVHPDFQGRGLSKLHLEHFLARWADARQPIALDEGSTHPRLNRSSGPGSTRMRLANTIDVLSLPLDPGTMAKSGLDARGPRPLLKRARLRTKMLATHLRWRPFSAAAPRVVVRSLESFDHRADSLWERTRGAFDFAVVRDRQYLNWRYSDPRAGIYRVRAALGDGDGLSGFAVTATIDGGAQIVDLVVLPGDPAALRALIDDTVTYAREEQLAFLSVIMPRVHPYRETFRRFGFIVSRSLDNVGHRERNDSILDFLSEDQAARVHMAFGDTDHI